MDRLAPSAYHDPREVVWKHLVAQAYWDILEILRRERIAIGDFDAFRISFLQSFNSHYDIDLLCRRAEATVAALLAFLVDRNRTQAAALVAAEIGRLRESLKQVMQSLQGLRQVEQGPSYVADGLITIAGKAAEEFAANPDYIAATLELIGESAPEVARLALGAWQRGFALDDELIALTRRAVQEGWSANDLLAEVLLREQRSGSYPSVREFEFVPSRGAKLNRSAKLQAVEQGYFLLGRLTSCIALMNRGSAPIDARRLDESCPLGAAMSQAGIALAPAQLQAFRRFTLVRCTHGLNPGEFTARIAASVRTTFPQALIASLMVREGKVHGGALAECMTLLTDFLDAPSRPEFVRRLLETGVLHGFGHRIHKKDSQSGERGLGGDPRVAFQLAAARQAFPHMQDRIDALEEMAELVRGMKPTLRPNTDFGAAIWFHCLGLTAEVGSALFTMHRLPGLIAQVINQLDVKSNALRPPLAVNLPYSA